MIKPKATKLDKAGQRKKVEEKKTVTSKDYLSDPSKRVFVKSFCEHLNLNKSERTKVSM